MATIIKAANSCKNIPWQNQPEGNHDPMWRYSENPIINRNPLKGVARIFNSAVVPYEGEFIGVFRVESNSTIPHLRVGRSKNGIDWTIEEKPIDFWSEDKVLWNPNYAYDPRVIPIEDFFYVVWCTDFYGPTVGVARTKDFKYFERIENAFLPFNRNGVLFPRRINGKYKLLSRPSDSGHTPFGDIFISESMDMIYWGKHRHVMEKGGSGWWQNLKIGSGPSPIETNEGWLLFYHGVTNTCNGFVYSIGCAILDIDEPSIVKYRSKDFCLTPERTYEEVGFVPNVVFPCAAITDADSGKIAIYYGAADSYVALAFTTIDIIIAYLKENHEIVGKDQKIGK